MEAPARFRLKSADVEGVRFTGDPRPVEEAFPELNFTYEIGGYLTLDVPDDTPTRKHRLNIDEWVLRINGVFIVMTQRSVDTLLVRVI